MIITKNIKSYPNSRLYIQDETGSFITDLARATFLQNKSKEKSPLGQRSFKICFTPTKDFKSNPNTLYFIKDPGEIYSCVSFELDPLIVYEDGVTYEVDGKTSV